MKETGIIMSGNHPQLILEGTKTQTRRVIKKPEQWMIEFDGESYTFEDKYGDCQQVISVCPYGQVGDRLWVRETWATEKRLDKFSGSALGDVGEVALWFKVNEVPSVTLERGRWRSSRFMPRWASRITLEITEVRVERVQEISHQDCIAEGAEYMPNAEPREQRLSAAQIVFAGLWDSLNAKRGYGWEVNPWCWVISFKGE